jgi:hypothetical protein
MSATQEAANQDLVVELLRLRYPTLNVWGDAISIRLSVPSEPLTAITARPDDTFDQIVFDLDGDIRVHLLELPRIAQMEANLDQPSVMGIDCKTDAEVAYEGSYGNTVGGVPIPDPQHSLGTLRDDNLPLINSPRPTLISDRDKSTYIQRLESKYSDLTNTLEVKNAVIVEQHDDLGHQASQLLALNKYVEDLKRENKDIAMRGASHSQSMRSERARASGLEIALKDANRENSNLNAEMKTLSDAVYRMSTEMRAIGQIVAYVNQPEPEQVHRDDNADALALAMRPSKREVKILHETTPPGGGPIARRVFDGIMDKNQPEKT